MGDITTTSSFPIGSVIGAGAGLAGSLINAITAGVTNKQNLDYAKAENDKTREREDNAFQRAVADAKLAGLSPLAVTGGAPTSQSLNYRAEAPQLDMSSIIGALTSMDSIRLEKERIENEKRLADHKIGIENLEFAENVRQFDEKLKTEYDFKDKQLNEDIRKFNQTLLFQNNELKFKKDTQNNQDLFRMSKDSRDKYENLCKTLGIAPRTQTYNDYNAYLNAYQTFQNNYVSLLNDESFSDSRSGSTSSSVNASVGGNRSSGNSQRYGNVGDSQSYGIGLNMSGGGAQSLSASADFTRSNSIQIMKDLVDKGVYFPIFEPKSYKSY